MSNRLIVKNMYHTLVQSPILTKAEKRQSRILDADYKKIDIEDYVDDQDHLSVDERQQLYAVLQNNQQLFKGGLGTLRIPPVRLELKEGTQPYSGRAYPIPQAYKRTTKTEINRLEQIRVLEKNSDSQ